MNIDEALINAVKRHPCLYDLASPNYKNVGQKDALWDDIGRQLNLDGDTCRKKWKMLRDIYRRAKRSKILASGSAAPSRRRKQWRHYEAMLFLEAAQSSRCTVGNLEVEDIDNPRPPEVVASGRSTPTSTTSAITMPTPNSAALPEYQKIQDDFGAVIAKISDTANKISERFASKEETDVDMAFSAMANLVNSARMPQNLRTTVISKVQAIVFCEVQNWTARNIDEFF